MINTTNRPPRPKLTKQILGYALIDVFGLSCVGIGASWFAAEKAAILTNFPSSAAEAVVCTVGGVAVMIWSVARILREIAKQAPEMQAKYDAYVSANHPEKAKMLAELRNRP